MENYYLKIWKFQNSSFTNKSNINKSDLNAKVLHLKERESSKLAKNFIEYVYWACLVGSSIPNEIKQNNVTMVEILCENKMFAQNMFH